MHIIYLHLLLSSSALVSDTVCQRHIAACGVCCSVAELRREFKFVTAAMNGCFVDIQRPALPQCESCICGGGPYLHCTLTN